MLNLLRFLWVMFVIVFGLMFLAGMYAFLYVLGGPMLMAVVLAATVALLGFMVPRRRRRRVSA